MVRGSWLMVSCALSVHFVFLVKSSYLFGFPNLPGINLEGKPVHNAGALHRGALRGDSVLPRGLLIDG